jgi:hypothetical protein
LEIPADFLENYNSARNAFLIRESAGKSLGIPVDFFSQENPQENHIFLVVVC